MKGSVARSLACYALLLGAVANVGCANSAAERESLDHVVIGIADLERGVHELQRLTGIKPAYGGAHPELGTHNALISLGARQYLEILAPRSGAQLADQVKMLPVLSELTPAAWAIQTSNAVETIAVLQRAGYQTTKPSAASRTKPDGSVLRWTIFYITGPRIPMVPFFIEWDAASRHPATDSPGGCDLASIEVATSEQAELESLLRVINVPATVTMRDKSAMAVTLSCDGRLVRIGQL